MKSLHRMDAAFGATECCFLSGSAHVWFWGRWDQLTGRSKFLRPLSFFFLPITCWNSYHSIVPTQRDFLSYLFPSSFSCICIFRSTESRSEFIRSLRFTILCYSLCVFSSLKITIRLWTDLTSHFVFSPSSPQSVEITSPSLPAVRVVLIRED